MNIRVRAIIIKDSTVLLIHRIKNNKEYWVFPGGGVEQDETHTQALKREIWEELGVEINTGDVFHRLTIEAPTIPIHDEIFYFAVITGGTLGTGTAEEFQDEKNGIYEIEWVPFNDFENKIIFPEEVKYKLLDEVIMK